MRVWACAVVLLYVLLTLCACQPAAEPTEADVAAIRSLIKTYCASSEAGDVAGLLALRTDDVLQMPPDSPITRGKEVLEDFYRGVFEQFSAGLTWPVE